MQTVLIVIHLLVVLALVGVVLLQRSEGGALGIGGGGGGGAGGFMTTRGAASALTRITAMLAVAFFATSITLTILSRGADTGGGSVLDRAVEEAGETAPAAPAPGGSVLDQLQQLQGQDGPQVPQAQWFGRKAQPSATFCA